jgi:hypothetical protein
LPLAANRIFQGVFDFGAIKRALTRQIGKLATRSPQAFCQRVFGTVPTFFGSNALLGTGREFVDDVGETKVFVDLLQQGGEGHHFVLNLVFGAENMAVVLGEGAHAHDAVQATAGLVAVTLAKFTEAQWQIAVTLDALLEDDDVPRAVHRLQRIVTFFRLGDKHVLTVFVPMAGFFPQALIQDLRAFDFHITVVTVDTAHVLLHFLPHGPAFGVPKHRAWRMFVDVEQVQFTPEFAVITLFRLFQPGQVLLQIVFTGPGGAIHALQHFILAVTTPVGTGHFHQLEMLELAGAGHVRAPAQVFKRAFAVQAHVLIGRNAGNDLGFVVLAQTLEISHGLVTRQHPTHHWLVLVGQLCHAFFDGHQIFRGKGAAVREVVIKPVVDHWTNRDLRLRKQVLDRIGQQVRCRVANQLQAFRVFGRDDGQIRVGGHAEAGVDQLAIDFAAQSGLGQTRANRGSHLGHGHRTGEFTQRTVGKFDLNHESQKVKKRGMGRA